MTALSPFAWDTAFAFVLSAVQMALYAIGMLLRKIHKGSIGDKASKSHFLNKYYLPIYLLVPFVGIFGQAILTYSGYQRIAPLNIFPLLLVGNLIGVHVGILLTGFV